MQAGKWCWAFVAVALWGVGCGGTEAVDEGEAVAASDVVLDQDEATDEADALGTTESGVNTVDPSFVSVRRDFRKCAFPYCGGFWVKDLNRKTTEQYVYALNFGPSGLPVDVRNGIAADATGVVLRGKLSRATAEGVRRLIVYEAWRGLPGVKADPSHSVFAITERFIQCVKAPCDIYAATPVNVRSATERSFAHLETAMALMPFVDAEWLASRALGGGALVAGDFIEMAYDGVPDGPGAPIKTLDASQVYLRLPDNAGPCPVFKIAACPAGQTWTYSRNADRCVFPVACQKPAACIRIYPQCAKGYYLSSWPGEGGCPAYACEPDFVGPTFGATVDPQD